MKQRLLFLLRLYFTLLFLFVGQKMFFMLFNLTYATGTTFVDALLVLLHGLRLDSVTTCYLLVIPTLFVAVSIFCHDMPLRKALTWYYAPIAVLMTLAFAGDTVLYYFWGAKLDANDLVYAKNPKDLLASVTFWSILLGAAVIGLFIFHYLRRLKHATPERFGKKPRRVWVLVMLPLLALEFLGIRGGVSESTANVSYAYFSPTPYLNHAAINPLFNIVHSMFKSEDLDNEFNFYDDEQLDQLTADAYPQDAAITDTLLNTRRPDILLIIWEGGGSRMMLNDSVAPCYQQLRQEGVFFSNCYANNFRTDRGTVSILNGWPGLPTTSLMKMPDKCRKLPALAKTLQAEGYHTEFYYGGDIDFTNMRCYLNETGFQRVEGDAFFSQAQARCKWGVADQDVLNTAMLPAPQKPCFRAILTLSSHEPWDVEMQRLGDPRQNAFAYTDSCLGAFVAQLRQSPEWQNLLVVIIPDHGVPVADIPTSSDYRVAQIPMLWIGGAVSSPREISVLMNQSDFVATLLAQMGIDARHFTFSRNVLSPAYQNPFALHAYKNGMNYIDSTGVTSFDCVSQQEATNAFEPSPTRLQKTKALLQHIYHVTAGL